MKKNGTLFKSLAIISILILLCLLFYVGKYFYNKFKKVTREGLVPNAVMAHDQVFRSIPMEVSADVQVRYESFDNIIGSGSNDLTIRVDGVETRLSSMEDKFQEASDIVKSQGEIDAAEKAALEAQLAAKEMETKTLNSQIEDIKKIDIEIEQNTKDVEAELAKIQNDEEQNERIGDIENERKEDETNKRTRNLLIKEREDRIKASLESVCFAPTTKVMLLSGEIIELKDVEIGDVLKDKTVVYATMKIKNTDEQGNLISQMYRLPNMGENNEDILVTGGHLIKNRENESYFYVSKHPLSVPLDEKWEQLICLITNTHTIPIGEDIFGDWEDNQELPDIIKLVPKKIEHE